MPDVRADVSSIGTVKKCKDNFELCRDGDTAQFACVSVHIMNVRSPHHLRNAIELVTTGSDKVPTSLSHATCCCISRPFLEAGVLLGLAQIVLRCTCVTVRKAGEDCMGIN